MIKQSWQIRPLQKFCVVTTQNNSFSPRIRMEIWSLSANRGKFRPRLISTRKKPANSLLITALDLSKATNHPPNPKPPPRPKNTAAPSKNPSITTPNMFAEKKYATIVYAGQDGKLNIIISAKNLNLNNFWSGGWRSVYTLDVSSQGTVELAGNIRLNVHYFEDGNVQLNTDYHSRSNIDVGAAGATGKAVAEAIEKIESQFQQNLGNFYVAMHEETFKAMRRILPVTKTKMDWRSHIHSLASQVSGAK
eukprot:GABV01001370.1.p1 GENE.GABV01001370.1~~GABV01001370.1.p1  ORF type:complete len:249 (+),score=67.16 GABV01001370.1:150-896(+)